MSFRWSAFVGVAFAFYSTTGVMAQMHGIPLSHTIYVKWSGALDQATLADGSVLNEYVAQTYSENVIGASVQFAFVPRFDCSPIFSVRLSAAAAKAISDETTITLTIDGVDMEFPAIIDRAGPSREYTYDAGKEDQRRLRALIDASSMVTMNWIPTQENTDQGADAADPISIPFSLLGSKLSAQAVEAQCKAHVPAPQ